MSIRDSVVAAISNFLINEKVKPRKIEIKIEYDGGTSRIHIDGDRIETEAED